MQMLDKQVTAEDIRTVAEELPRLAALPPEWLIARSLRIAARALLDKPAVPPSATPPPEGDLGRIEDETLPAQPGGQMA
jgi:hypothetical protein